MGWWAAGPGLNFGGPKTGQAGPRFFGPCVNGLGRVVAQESLEFAAEPSGHPTISVEALSGIIFSTVEFIITVVQI